MSCLFAVHISDGVLQAPWLVAGFACTILLALAGAWRVRDEEIPRIALLTAAFFIASLIHVRVGPASVHLLLNGLVGVILGWRAAIAIPVGVLLQAVLFGHGGFTTIGINSLVMTLPALGAGLLFVFLRNLPWSRLAGLRAGIVALSALFFVGSLILAISLLNASAVDLVNPLRKTSKVGGAGAAVVLAALDHAKHILLMPITLLFAAGVAVLAAWVERKAKNAAQFPLGLLVGQVTVLATVALNCLVLLFGGEQHWALPVAVLVLLHLPIAVIEGVVIGFVVGLLARVRPDIVGMQVPHVAVMAQYSPAATALIAGGVAPLHRESMQSGVEPPHSKGNIEPSNSAICNSRSLLLALMGVVLSAGTAYAHRLEGEYKIISRQKVRVESWFDITGDSPEGAIVQVFGSNDRLLTEGILDAEGFFVFSFSRAESLRIVISAGAGHRKELRISQAELERALALPSSAGSEEHPARATRRTDIVRLVLKTLLGFGIIAALAILGLAWTRRGGFSPQGSGIGNTSSSGTSH